MSDEPDDIILRLLRETRAEMVSRFDGLDHRLHRIEQWLGTIPAPEGQQASRTQQLPAPRIDQDFGSREQT